MPTASQFVIHATAVHAAARIEQAAAAGKAIVSRTVADLMVGNDAVRFEELGSQVLKDLPGEWTLLRAVA